MIAWAIQKPPVSVQRTENMEEGSWQGQVHTIGAEGNARKGVADDKLEDAGDNHEHAAHAIPNATESEIVRLLDLRQARKIECEGGYLHLRRARAGDASPLHQLATQRA